MRAVHRASFPFATLLAAGALLIAADMPLAADSQTRQQGPRVERTSPASPGSSSAGSASTRSSAPPSRSSAAPRSQQPTRSRARSGDQTRPSRGDSGRRSARVESSGSHDDGASTVSGQHRDRRGYRGHHGHRYRGHHYYGYGYGHHGWGVGFYPYWGARWGWGPYWSHYGPYGYYGPPVRVYYAAGEGLGGLDLDVRPEKAEIYLNGQRIGVADNYDGFPTYLWLEEGTYDVVIYAEGYETIARQYSVIPGIVIDVEDRMTPGEATRPEDLPATTTANRDRRLRADRERAERLEREDERWRDRAEDYRRRKGDDGWDARAEPSRLYLSVEPRDAAVYLDGRALGTGDELSRLHAGLLVDAGEHELEVVRPGYRSKTVDFDIEEAGELRLDVELEREDA